MGLVPPRRRRRHRKLAPRRTGERGRWVAVGGAAARAGAHERSGHRRGPPRRRGVRRGARRGPPSWDPAPDAGGGGGGGGGGGRLSTLLVGARQVVTCRGPARVRALLAHGSTTIEVKSGYGLDPANELKQLRAIRETAAAERAALVPTFLGAHEVPPEFRDRRAEYIRQVCDEMLPAVAREHLA